MHSHAHQYTDHDPKLLPHFLLMSSNTGSSCNGRATELVTLPKLDMLMRWLWGACRTASGFGLGMDIEAGSPAAAFEGLQEKGGGGHAGLKLAAAQLQCLARVLVALQRSLTQGRGTEMEGARHQTGNMVKATQTFKPSKC
eukprot:1157909-Pelagomonas_calceolata.AAC.12